ncbi:MAG: hypothetical protein AAFU60_09450, partial [Bacteroidota bacterium]
NLFAGHILNNETGTLQADRQIECFDIELYNTTTGRLSENLWLALEENVSDMSVVSVTNVTSASNLPLMAYADGTWVEVASSLAGASFIELEICVEYDDCNTNTMTIRQGWDCAGYPTDPNSSVCPSYETTEVLRIVPQIAAVQGDFISQPSIPADLCTTLQYDIRVNSSQAANLIDPRADITLPDGMTLVGNVEIEYPVLSGNFEVASPTVTGNSFLVNISDHSLVNDSLLGTANADPVIYTSGEDRQARIRFSVDTDCDFISGDIIRFRPFGEQPCGSTADGSGDTFRSSKLRISSASPEYDAIFSINIASSNTITDCGLDTVSVSVTLADAFPTDGLDGTSGSQDSILVRLPSSLVYETGSLTCTSLPLGSCPMLDGTNSTSDSLLLVIPAGITIPDAGAANISFQFAVSALEGINCVVTDSILIEAFAAYDLVTCPSVPGTMTCPTVTASIGDGFTEYTITKPEIIVNAFDVACEPSGTFNYSGQLQIDAGVLADGVSLEAEIYCLDANGDPVGGPIETFDFGLGQMSTGETYDFSGTFGGCDASNGVQLVVARNTDSGDFQCICAEVSANTS